MSLFIVFNFVFINVFMNVCAFIDHVLSRSCILTFVFFTSCIHNDCSQQSIHEVLFVLFKYSSVDLAKIVRTVFILISIQLFYSFLFFFNQRSSFFIVFH